MCMLRGGTEFYVSKGNVVVRFNAMIQERYQISPSTFKHSKKYMIDNGMWCVDW